MLQYTRHTTLFVSDQDRALNFYEKLGLEKRDDVTGPFGRWLTVAPQATGMRSCSGPARHRGLSPRPRSSFPDSSFSNTTTFARTSSACGPRGSRSTAKRQSSTSLACAPRQSTRMATTSHCDRTPEKKCTTSSAPPCLDRPVRGCWAIGVPRRLRGSVLPPRDTDDARLLGRSGETMRKRDAALPVGRHVIGRSTGVPRARRRDVGVRAQYRDVNP